MLFELQNRRRACDCVKHLITVHTASLVFNCIALTDSRRFKYLDPLTCPMVIHLFISRT